jgi:hypothetical protein
MTKANAVDGVVNNSNPSFHSSALNTTLHSCPFALEHDEENDRK